MAEWTNPRLEGRIPELDGVRGLAILLVLVHHYVVLPVYSTPGSALAYFLGSLRLAWSGVDLFFVLSGFLIGGILRDARGSRNYFSTFYIRRAWRIWPVLSFWIAIFLIASPLSADRLWNPIFGHEIPTWSYFVFAQNIPMALKQTWGSHWLAVTWSLAVEEQFYLLLPVVVAMTSSARRLATIVAVASVAAIGFRVGFAATGNPYFGPYMLLVCRADALGCGVLAALAVRNADVWNWLVTRAGLLRKVALVLATGLIPLTLRPQGWLMNTIGYTWLALFYTSVVLLAVTGGPVMMNRVLLFRPLRSLGMIAYGLYICHDGILTAASALLFRRSFPVVHNFMDALVSAGYLGFSVGLAALSWNLMEKPLLRRAAALHPYRRVVENTVAAA